MKVSQPENSMTKEEIAKIFDVPVDAIPDTPLFTELTRLQCEYLRATLDSAPTYDEVMAMENCLTSATPAESPPAPKCNSPQKA